jgi:dTDP-4-amino-4,6-dideoxygalactose transaminase
MAEGAYKVTEEFEKILCEYTGAPYAVALDSESNAIFLSLMYEGINGATVTIPARTYPSVPCEIIHAGGRVQFEPTESSTLTGAYQLKPTRTWDSALRFTADMYLKNTFMCLSFTGPYKHLKLSKAGAILTDDKIAYEWFKRSRFSGRREMSYHEDDIDMLGWNFYLMPEIATRGILLMNQFFNKDRSKKQNADITLPYPDLSKFSVYNK